MSDSSSDAAGCQLPSIQEFCITISLYREYDISKCTHQEIVQFEYFQGAIDAYCLKCKRESVFQAHISDLNALKKAVGSGNVFGQGVSTSSRGLDRTKPPASPHRGIPSSLPDVTQPQEPREISHNDRDFCLEFCCTRDQTHIMRFYFSIRNSKICKVGQYPSLADLHLSSISKYRKLLGKDRYAELARAIGLHAHDVGIGSFVYLRRVFEHLINKAHEVASQETGWDEGAFEIAHMPDKIRLLKNHLPEFMVQNANIYSILSKGIHDLTEDECLDYFATIETGIKLILEDEIARQEWEENIKVITSEIGRITGKIRGV